MKPPATEGYSDNWALVSLRVSPTGEMHAVGGDIDGKCDPLADCPYVGFERIKARLKRNESMRPILMEDTPWPLRDTLAKLIEAGEILLHRQNYDSDGYEQIGHAIKSAKQALARWPAQ